MTVNGIDCADLHILACACIVGMWHDTVSLDDAHICIWLPMSNIRLCISKVLKKLHSKIVLKKIILFHVSIGCSALKSMLVCLRCNICLCAGVLFNIFLFKSYLTYFSMHHFSNMFVLVPFLKVNTGVSSHM